MKKTNVYLDVANWLIGYIREKELGVGERLPSERELAVMMSVSRSSIREAARILESRHIIESKIGSGMFVTQDVDSAVYSIDLRKVNYKELLDVRMLLELQIIEELCLHATAENVTYMEEPLFIMEEDCRQGIYDVQHDNAFHHRMRSLASNQTMAQLVENLVIELDEYAVDFDQLKQIWLTTVPLHRGLLEAIRHHDIDEARTVYAQMKAIDEQGMELCFPAMSHAHTAQETA